MEEKYKIEGLPLLESVVEDLKKLAGKFDLPFS
jgi:hypothetical protein